MADDDAARRARAARIWVELARESLCGEAEDGDDAGHREHDDFGEEVVDGEFHGNP